MSLILKNLCFINNGGNKMKNTLLDDFKKIYGNINCDSLYCNCNDCSNKRLCDLVEDVIKSIGGFYNETKKNFT